MTETWTVEITGPRGEVYAHIESDLLVQHYLARQQGFTKEYTDLLTALDLARISIVANANADRFS